MARARLRPAWHHRQHIQAPMMYLLRDEFWNARNAGAVNGTVAEPGPGTRTVRDVESKITIASGALSLAAQATGAYNEEDLVYADVAITRAAGRVLLAAWNVSADSFHYPLAWVSSITPTWSPFHVAAGFQRRTSALTLINNALPSGFGANLAAFATSVTYRLAIVLRSTGAYYLIKGGAFTNWTLLWVGTTNATTPLYAACAGHSAAWTLDSVRIPVPLWLPSPIACDLFGRADGALGSSEVTGPDGQTVVSRVWTGATWAIASGAAVNTPTAGAEDISNGEFTTNLTGWTPVNATLSQVDSTVDPGAVSGGADNGAMKAVNTVGTNSECGLQNLDNAVGTWVHVTSRAYAPSSNTGVNVASIAIQNAVAVAGTVTAEDVWQTVQVTTRITGVGQLRCRIVGNTIGDTAYFDSASAKPLTLSTLFASLTDAATADVKLRVQVGALTTGTQCGLVARLDNAANPQNFIIMYFDGAGNVKVEEMVAGTYAATVLSAVKAFTASDWLELDLSGTAYRAYHITNAGVATLLGSGTVQTATGTLHGLFSTYSANTVLGMEVWPKGTGGEYAQLDRF